MSGLTSGYLIVAFGSKNRRRVSAMPPTMPRPGMRSIRVASSRVHDRDRGGGHEQVEQRGRQEPLPGEPHELVDSDTRERPAHPDEGEDERVRLAEEPQEAGDPVESDVGDPEDRGDRDEVEQDEADDQCLPALDPAVRQPEGRRQEQRPDDRHDRAEDQQPDSEGARVEVEGDLPGPWEWRVPAAEKEGP